MRVSCVHLCIASSLFCAGCGEATPPTPHSALPFQYTNLVHQPGAFREAAAHETIINFTNLVWFGHQTDKISMGLGPADYEISVFFDRTNRTVRKIVQQTTAGTNHYWLVDTDGDGIPEERHPFHQKERELLIHGEWAPSRGQSTNREAFVNSNWIPVRFENDRWRPSLSQ